MTMFKYRRDNPNWKGGRRVSTNGYIQIKVASEHPLRNANGYAYEHRLKASEKIGRWVSKSEIVHHIDGNKQNNSFENLQVYPTISHHLLQHRKKQSKRRMPDEPNKFICCKCGCGRRFKKFDTFGREREYKSGHNVNPSLKSREILKILDVSDFPLQLDDLIRITKSNRGSITVMLSKLSRENKIVRVFKGLYGKIGTPKRENPTIPCACGCGRTIMKYDSSWRERKFVSGHNNRKV